MMKLAYFLSSTVLILSSCAVTSADSTQQSASRSPVGSARAIAPSQSPSQAANMEAIGRKIWMNECAGTKKGLVSWNAGEEFPSLGIGHFIWYPASYAGGFDESFPKFVVFARAHGLVVPSVMEGKAPWQNKAAFLKADVPGGVPDQMREWLAMHLKVQSAFIMQRSQEALQRIMAASAHPQLLQSRYQAVAQTPHGIYALVDYVNFKGEGIKPDERYQGKGWGLAQVLEEMKDVPVAQARAEFSAAAQRVLTRRVALSPPARGEARWLEGWKNRCKGYL